MLMQIKWNFFTDGHLKYLYSNARIPGGGREGGRGNELGNEMNKLCFEHVWLCNNKAHCSI